MNDPAKKIGIYSGVFDPVHNGHIAFAEAATKAAGLDAVYFMVERTPRRKTDVTAYQHRIAMVRIATKSRTKLNVLEVQQPVFTVEETLPRLRQAFRDAQLYLLLGSDLFSFIDTWPGYEQLRSQVSFVVGLRGEDVVDRKLCNDTDKIIASPLPHAASSRVRETVRQAQDTSEQIPRTVRAYIEIKELYR
jgi:nicotinate-nucleotide adenylyltransferase